MKIQLTLSADEGKVLVNGNQRLHMVHIYDSVDYSQWHEEDEEAENK